VSLGAIVLLALALSMDATAVSAARGLALTKVQPTHVLKVALCFGGFHVLMPTLGWLLGARVGPFVERWSHWVVFVVLAGLGGKMLWEARTHADDDDKADVPDPFAWRPLLALGVAISVDALGAGITLPIARANPLIALPIIGGVTALMSAAGLLVGRRFGALVGRRLDLVGGLVLIALGGKALVEHYLH
jgi:putative Mn2+ efflux pump MntP